jgi:hypothetical protein
LQKINPIIDWKNANWIYPLNSQRVKLIRSKKELKKMVREAKVALILIKPSAAQPTSNSEVDDISKQDAFPPEYEDYADVFSTEQAGLLPPHHDLEHRIELEDGFVVTPEGLAMDQEKVMAIRDWPIPRNVHDIQAFLGFTGFYRRFIKGYSKITTLLIERTKGNQPSSF